MTADPVSRFFELQIRHIHFVAQIPHLEELKQNDTSFNRTGVECNIDSNSSNAKRFFRPLGVSAITFDAWAVISLEVRF